MESCHHCTSDVSKPDRWFITYRTWIVWILALPLLGHMVIPMSYGVNPYLLWVLATVIQIYGGAPFYVGAWHAMKNGVANMELLIAIGSTSAYLYSALAFWMEGTLPYLESSAVIIATVLTGQDIEGRSRRQAFGALSDLLALQPQRVSLWRGTTIIDVALSEVAVGDKIFVAVGALVPVDGIIVEGSSTLDESLLTGESMPVAKEKGDEVFAATVNEGASLTVEVRGVGEATVHRAIARAVEKARQQKAPIQRAADGICAIFVPAILLISALTALGWWIVGANGYEIAMHSAAVLLVACPCTLGLATPAVIAVATGIAARHGIAFRSAAIFERTAQVSCIAFDKTGTLTLGHPSVSSVEITEGFPAEEVLPIAASLAQLAIHPLSKAIATYCHQSAQLKAEEIHVVPGRGTSAVIESQRHYIGSYRWRRELFPSLPDVVRTDDDYSHVYLWDSSGNVLAHFICTDPLRPEAVETVAELKKMGFSLALFSGDRTSTTWVIGNSLGIKATYGSLLPFQKVEQLQSIHNRGQVVAMVGDGTNDAPALTAADVGIAMGSGSQIALQSADIALIGSDLKKLNVLFKLCRTALSKIRQNLLFAFLYNGIGVPLAAFGWLPPLFAAFAMAASSASVLLNSLSLKRYSFLRTHRH